MNYKAFHCYIRQAHSWLRALLPKGLGLALFFSLILLPVNKPSLVLSSAAAKSPFSIPGLRTLKRKLGLQKRRYRRKRNRRNQNRKTTPVLAVPIKGQTQEHLAPPPLPVRNPRHLARSPNKNERAQKALIKRTRWKKRASTNKTRPPLQQTRKNTALPPLPTRKPYLPPSKVKEPDWTQSTIDEAVSQCSRLGINLPLLAPAKKGRCGNPAPVLLANIGGLSKQVHGDVSIRPAATLSCPMISSLRQWFARSVQPLAQKHFGKPVRQIRNISSYVCRNRYGDTKTRISEHAFANALDIAWFELEGGMKVSLLHDWDSPDQDKASFLHELHTSACKHFGTVLGPNANAAHKNHFHLDRAPRRRSNYCR